MTNKRTIQLTVRVPKATIRRLDRWIAEQQVVGARFSRTTVLRDLLSKHLGRASDPAPVDVTTWTHNTDES